MASMTPKVGESLTITAAAAVTKAEEHRPLPPLPPTPGKKRTQSSDTTTAVVTTALATASTEKAATHKPLVGVPSNQQKNLNAILEDAASSKSVVDTLLEWGKTGGVAKVDKEEIRTCIAKKIEEFREKARNERNLPSIRSDLCRLTGIVSTHYSELKEEVYNLLIRLLESDPIEPFTAEGVLEIVIDLNKDLVLLKAQTLTILFQRKLARAFSASVELYLRHYSQLDHVNAITENQKRELIETQKSFSGLNTQENVSLEFASKMALEASKRLTSDNSSLMELIDRISHLAKAVKSAYDKDVFTFFSELKEAFQGVDHKIKEKWFESLLVLRDLVQRVSDPVKKLTLIQTFLVSKKESSDWKFIYGAIEMMGGVISQTDDVKTLMLAICGQSPKKVDTSAADAVGLPMATLAAKVAQKVVPRFPGVADFLEFNYFVTKAFFASNDDKKADKAIQAKANEVCAIITKKLASTYEGRESVLNTYLGSVSNRNSDEKNFLQVFVKMIPPNPKEHVNWLGKPSSKEQSLSTDSPSTPKKPFSPPLPPLPLKPSTVSSKQPSSAAKVAAVVGSKTPAITETDVKSTAAALKVGEQGGTALHEAAERGDVDACSKLIKDNADLKAKDQDSSTPLILAAKNKHHKICEILLQAGSDRLQRDLLGRTALHWAVKNEDLETVKNCLKYKDWLDAKSKNGNTALMMAASQGNKEICQHLLLEGANPLARDQAGKTVMHHAAQEGKIGIVQLLSTNQQLVHAKAEGDWTPLLLASKRGFRDVCDVLLKAGADPFAREAAKGWNSLHWAADEGSVEVVRLLATITDLVDSISKHGATPLMTAADRGHQEICEILIKCGANLRTTHKESGENALHRAVEKGETEVVRLLASTKDREMIGAKIRADDECTPLLTAALLGHDEIFTILLKAGADPKEKNARSETSLHLACKKPNDGGEQTQNEEGARQTYNKEGKLAIIRLLLAHEEILDLQDGEDITAAMIAAASGNFEAFEMFTKAGADLSLKDNQKSTILHYAAAGGNVDTIATIVKLKESPKWINAKGDRGRTPLQIAIFELGNEESVEVLLKAGSDVHITTTTGKNVLHCAAMKGKHEVIKKFLLHLKTNESLKEDDKTLHSLNESDTKAHRAQSSPVINWQKKFIDALDDDEDTPLILAAMEGHTKACEFLLDAGADPLHVADDGGTCLHAAIKGKTSKDLIRRLASYKQLVNGKRKDGMTPLLLALQERDLETAEYLLSIGADPLVIESKEKFNAMILAAANGWTSVVHSLTKYNPLINSAEKYGFSPLMFAAQEGHLEICEILVKAGADVCHMAKDGENVLHLALEKNYDEVVRYFSRYKKIINEKDKRGLAPFLIAVANGNLKPCQTLLEAGADPNVTDNSGWNALHFAAFNGHREIIDFLNNIKTFVNKRTTSGLTPLMLAARRGFVEICVDLMKSGANPLDEDQSQKTAIHHAAEHGQSEIIRILAKNDRLIHLRTKDGCTPLLLAAGSGDRESCNVLITAKADLSAVDSKGLNAMYYAARKGHSNVINLWASQKELINSKSKQEITPLMSATAGGYKEACEILLKCGADALAVDDFGKNVLHVAAERGQTHMVQFFSANKKLIDSKTLAGFTPLMLAAQRGLEEICKVLIEARADVSAVDEYGWNAMHLAVKGEWTEVVDLFLDKTELFSSNTKDNRNQLMIAIEVGNVDLASRFIQGNDDLNRKIGGKSPLELARELHGEQMVKDLLKIKK